MRHTLPCPVARKCKKSTKKDGTNEETKSRADEAVVNRNIGGLIGVGEDRGVRERVCGAVLDLKSDVQIDTAYARPFDSGGTGDLKTRGI